MLTFNKTYFSLTILLLAIEVLIAVYVTDNFIRPYLGDALVVILLYCFLKSFFRIPKLIAVFAVMAFAFLIEFFQWLNIIKLLGLEQSTITRIVIGSTFSWMDLLAYVAGLAIVLLTEKYLEIKKLQITGNF